MSTTKRPIPTVPALAVIFNILGGIILLAAIAVAVGAVMQIKTTPGSMLVAAPAVGGLLLAGIFYLGTAEVIQLIARIALEACRSADAADRSAAAAEAQAKQRLYLYHVGADVRGPVTIEVLRSLRSVKVEPRYVTGETLVCRVGESEWKRLAESMDKSA
jgi:hypothetical protein